VTGEPFDGIPPGYTRNDRAERNAVESTMIRHKYGSGEA
jgi:hypothetical protein